MCTHLSVQMCMRACVHVLACVCAGLYVCLCGWATYLFAIGGGTAVVRMVARRHQRTLPLQISYAQT